MRISVCLFRSNFQNWSKTPNSSPMGHARKSPDTCFSNECTLHELLNLFAYHELNVHLTCGFKNAHFKHVALFAVYI